MPLNPKIIFALLRQAGRSQHSYKSHKKLMCRLRREIQINIRCFLSWLTVAQHHYLRIAITTFSMKKYSFDAFQCREGKVDSHQKERGRGDEEVLQHSKPFKYKKLSGISKIVLNLMHLGKTSCI